MILKHSLLASQKAAVKDSRILNVCMAAYIKKIVLFKHTQHMLKIRNVSYLLLM